MADRFERSTRYIIDFLKWLAPEASVKELPDFTFRINLQEETTDVRFDRSEMDDFEIALERFQNTAYFHTLENRVRFRFFVALGSKGLIPYVAISSELLREKGEWLKSLRTNVKFDPEFSAILYQGLKLLAVSIGKTLASGLKLPDVEAEQSVVANLTSYYEEKKHLNSTGASMESLSYLKAAAVCVIMEKEKSRGAAKIPRVRKAVDAEIYSIVSMIRDDPFRDIKLPEALHDYVLQHGEIAPSKTPAFVRQTAPDPEQTKLDELLQRLDPKLRRRREGAWAALQSENPDRLSQAANSMVELLDQVIGQVCKDVDLATFLTKKYQTNQKTEWMNATRKWIQQTKDNLHSTKHHVDHQSEQLTKALLTTAENVILVLLE
jgi:Predicted pPIWI-associating nuclease